MPRKLAVLFDGTWNTTKDRTNVIRLSELIAPRGRDGSEQLKPFYDKGVGTHALDRLSGGVFGYGLSDNIRDGYRWLAANFQPGDELFLFGFSRGAYTARSLAGLIHKCGILRSADESLVEQAYDLYRDKDIHPGSADATAFRASFAQDTRIRFVGVWDTVGSLGIPATGVPFSRDYYTWHDTELSKIVDYAYHAHAIDEHRKDFARRFGPCANRRTSMSNSAGLSARTRTSVVAMGTIPCPIWHSPGCNRKPGRPGSISVPTWSSAIRQRSPRSTIPTASSCTAFTSGSRATNVTTAASVAG